MNVKGYIAQIFRDPCYDHRKILNSEDLIKTAQYMGYSYSKIADCCGVSKTMISHWGSVSRPEKPTYIQLEPMFEMCGRGRFIYKLEPLPASAIEYQQYLENVPMVIMTFIILVFFWYIMIKPCSDNWGECNKLPWYKMGSYEIIKHKETLKEFKEWKRMSQENRESMFLRRTP